MPSSGPSLSPADFVAIPSNHQQQQHHHHQEQKQRQSGDGETEQKEAIIDLKQRMQYMIDIQNQYSSSLRTDESATNSGVTTTTTSDTAAASPPTTSSRSFMPTAQTLAPNALYPNNPITTENSGDAPDPDVGRGQLYFPSTMPNYAATAPGTEAAAAMMNPQLDYAEDYFQQPQNPRYSDYVDPYEMSYQDDEECCQKCCCLWKPLTKCLKRLWKAESLHRSVCYGAIDGMLTGAGIVATFCGMGVIDSSTTARNLWVVAFAVAACTSDALCMAVGHVWSTHMLSSQSAMERQEERVAFESNPSDSKGKLVDMLLSRGMLKIDAMSIADTLEGYPDIFVSALVGENYVLGDADGNGGLSKSNSGSRSLTSGQLTDYGTYRSYGDFNEFEHDPEAAIVAAATVQSQKEATAMMVAFSIFGGVPGLILYVVSKMSTNTEGHDDAVMSATSVTMTMGCSIMLVLGYWKSCFFDGNWVAFAIEAVVVLFVCIGAAFLLGTFLSSLLPDDLRDAVVTPVVAPEN